MATKVLSSDKARAKWREVLDTAVAGEPVIVERYGNPVAVVISYADYEAGLKRVNEATAVYHTEQDNWQTAWQTLSQQLKQSGGLMPRLDKEEIVSQLRQTRQEIFEAEYAHLYR